MEYTDKDLERFWAKVDKSDDCWVWTSQLRGGYGLFKLAGKVVSAHRLSYLISNGYLPNKQIRHTCDNPPCVRPEHLIAGSRKQNSEDMILRDRHNGILRNEQILEIRSLPMTRTIISDVAARYGISETVARSILDGRSFALLPGSRKIVRQKSRSKLSVEDILEIKDALRAPWWGQVNFLSDKYGVSHSEISHIKSGRLHLDVTDTQ